uniref:Uncharacterized protein LOC110215288 isoform X2 n=1 Tax=Phascolarctos cinereus TaxID=38626 RepID=A0A6P5L3H5_PHACI|nr:uncharacterized protein LOC110215288 isoform X2 [Phascolarctos cinereus]
MIALAKRSLGDEFPVRKCPSQAGWPGSETLQSRFLACLLRQNVGSLRTGPAPLWPESPALPDGCGWARNRAAPDVSVHSCALQDLNVLQGETRRAACAEEPGGGTSARLMGDGARPGGGTDTAWQSLRVGTGLGAWLSPALARGAPAGPGWLRRRRRRRRGRGRGRPWGRARGGPGAGGPGPGPPGLEAALQKLALRRKKVLNAEETELYELALAAGGAIDPDVFKILVDLLKLNVAPLAVFQMLKSMCAGQRLATDPPGPESMGSALPLSALPDTRGRNRSSGAAVLGERGGREGSSQRMPRQPSASRLPKGGSTGKSPTRNSN